MWVYQATETAKKKALVIALHGCKQSAHEYATGSGWLKYAKGFSFHLLLPEQKRGWWGNNSLGCFNWFYRGDQRPGRGESQSIREMINTLILRNTIDPQRIYITGLSAGGAMTAVMLSNYPATFKGGAIIAGVPFGCSQVPSYVPAWWLGRSWFYVTPFHCMKPGLDLTAKQWADKVRSLHTSSTKKWPAVSIWHSTGDRVVAPDNARELVEQWTELHQIESVPQLEQHDDYTLYRYVDVHGNTAVSLYLLRDLEHGQPIKRRGWLSKENIDDCGEKGRYMINSSLCASYHIARSWGLIPH